MSKLGNPLRGKDFKSVVEVPKAPPPRRLPIPKPKAPPPPPPTPREELAMLTEKMKEANEALGVTPAPDRPAGQGDVVASLQYIIATYADDPVGFVRDILGADPDQWQESILRDIAAGERRISVRAGHGVGKSAVCSWLAIWHMVTRYPQKTVCLGGNTLVLTDRGWIPIKDVNVHHKVWDGVEWVTHEGLAHKGMRETMNLSGVRLTPDHNVLCGRTWTPAVKVAADGSALRSALATGSGNLPLRVSPLASKEGFWKEEFSRFAPAGAQKRNTGNPTSTRTWKRAIAATFALFDVQSRHGSSMSATAMLSRMMSSALDCWGASTASIVAATKPNTMTFTTMGAEASVVGGTSSTEWARSKKSIRRYGAAKCWNILSPWTGGTSPVLSWTGLTTPKGTRREIYGSSRVSRTHQTDEPYGNSSSASANLRMRLPVFDLVNSGPRNRFTVLSDRGPLIVHNCTAPTAGQLFDALFAEIKLWINRLPAPVRDLFDPTSEKVVLKAAPEASFISARTSSADRPEALAGIHSDHVLLICDEASAIPEAVYESAAGSMSGHQACTVLIGNPTRNSGLFFRTHHQLASEWKTYHVSCLDCRRVSRDFIKQISDTYGPDSNAYRVRVLGEFALREDDTLIPAELVDSAMSRDIVPDEQQPLVYGIDVARFGDDRSVMCKRRGNVVLEMKTWQGLDLMQLTGAIVNEAKIDGPAEICVDSIGLGSGVADRLREVLGEAKLDAMVRDVNVAEASAMNPQAAKLRDELWLAVKEWLNARACRIPRLDDLRAELVAPTYTFTSNGKIKVEGKQELKRRGMRSPDLADSLCLTFASIASRVGGRGTGWVKGKALRRNIKGVV